MNINLINFILRLFFLMPDWILRLFTLQPKKFSRGQVFDYQSMTFLNLIQHFSVPLDLENFSETLRSEINDRRKVLYLTKPTKVRTTFKDHILSHCEDVCLREYSAMGLNSEKIVLFFHGGGYVLSDVETYKPFTDFLVERLQYKVFALDYRKAPQNKFPLALEDALEAIRFLKNQGYSEQNIVLLGDSAGAHLAASLSFELYRSDEFESPGLQFLIYPMISPSLEFESMDLYAENFLLTKDAMRWFWKQFIGEQSTTTSYDLLQQKFIPDKDFNCKTVIITAGFDPLCDEGEAYALKLHNAGFYLKQLHYPSLFHGFISISLLRTARRAMEDMIDILKKEL